MQLELPWYPPGCVRAVLSAYLEMRSESVTEETRVHDYDCRVAWLLEVLGECTPAVAVTFAVLERAARAARGILRDVTIRRRLRFYASAVKYAAMRGLVPMETVPQMPPWLKDDGVKCEDYYTLAQHQAFRMALPPGRFRRFADLGFWTGMHTYDLVRTERWMLQPDHAWEGTDVRGAWWRRNHKNRKCAPCWIPLEPEARELAVEWLSDRAAPEARVVGPMNNLRRTFHIAAHRADVPAIRANLGLRASHATLLMAREYPYEYVRQVLGHEGEVSMGAGGKAMTGKRPTTLSSHYLRPSPDLLRPRSG